jgi:5-methylcytosine-specific restriction endonuclease McrA
MRALLQQRQGIVLIGGMRLTPCVYCRKLFTLRRLTLEHIKPLSNGGKSNPKNLALACSPCNTGKVISALPSTRATKRFVLALRLKSLAQSVRV